MLLASTKRAKQELRKLIVSTTVHNMYLKSVDNRSVGHRLKTG